MTLLIPHNLPKIGKNSKQNLPLQLFMRPNNVHDFVKQRVYCTHPHPPKGHLSMSAERVGHKFHFVVRYLV